MSDIGTARRLLREIAGELKSAGKVDFAARVEKIVGELMHRRKAARRAPIHSNKVTPEIREKILDLAETTDMHSSEIAAEVSVNPGRVSEILHGDK